MMEIVVGVDGSAPAAAALRWAAHEAAGRDARLTAVLAWGLFDQPGATVDIDPGYGAEDADRALGAALTAALPAAVAAAVEHRVVVGEVVACLGAEHVKLTTSVRPGGAAPVLLDAAVGADALVLGRRGVGGFSRLLVGSVTEHAAHHAPCPLVVLPPEEDDR
jgi:nucleotide-binding universal stress UspA family protein